MAASVSAEEAYYVVLRTVVAGKQANWVRLCSPNHCSRSCASVLVNHCSRPYTCEASASFCNAELHSGTGGDCCLPLVLIFSLMLQTVMGHMQQLRHLMGVSDDLHKVGTGASALMMFEVAAAAAALPVSSRGKDQARTSSDPPKASVAVDV